MGRPAIDDIQLAVKRAVAAAPPLTPDQRDWISAVFTNTMPTTMHDAETRAAA